jgi:hypothetical protein
MRIIRGFIVAFAVVGASGLAHAQQKVRPLRAIGVGTIEGPLRQPIDLRVQFRIGNVGNQPVTIKRSEILMVFSYGGWSYSHGETIARDNKFLGDSPTLAPGEERSYTWTGQEGCPPFYWVLFVQVSVAGGPAYEDMIAIPYRRPRFANPPPLRVSGQLFIALQEPLEVMELTSGQIWLPVIGQVTNLTGKTLTLKKWRFLLKDSAGKVALDADASDKLKLEKTQKTLNEFYHGFELPKDFHKGTLRIESEVELDGKLTPLVREAPVERVEGYTISSPVKGLFGCGGGPGCPGFHGHLHDPYARYSYDMGLFRDVDGAKTTHSGDTNKNESFFGWDQPIYCVADGKVNFVEHRFADHFGWKRNPASSDNNRILVDHANSQASCYYHIRQGSAKVKVGDHVKAGQVLAHLGNAGSSSEPHLHFGYLIFDQKVGYYKNVPVRIMSLKSEDGRLVDGIMKDGFYIYTPAPTTPR